MSGEPLGELRLKWGWGSISSAIVDTENSFTNTVGGNDLFLAPGAWASVKACQDFRLRVSAPPARDTIIGIHKTKFGFSEPGPIARPQQGFARKCPGTLSPVYRPRPDARLLLDRGPFLHLVSSPPSPQGLARHGRTGGRKPGRSGCMGVLLYDEGDATVQMV
ncbi:hypothetical protein CPLU01_03397 [Colletotrichum plurivorum]|uniref:Uncharacterized protein n=1 Tax=Colletotrichum plurivorum TaxID=2175906 RepID=A0A8H6KTT9_9PEZI|nr:hypothetical protein CPLU01_03397 [Colletotrichum plurivorum]